MAVRLHPATANPSAFSSQPFVPDSPGSSRPTPTDTAAARPRLLIIGGGALGSGVEDLYATDDVDVISFDIYASDLVQFLADAHRIPLASQSVDAVPQHPPGRRPHQPRQQPQQC